VRAVVSMPPRHGKTETLLFAIAWLLLQNPEMRLMYVSYAARIAEKKGRAALGKARRAGVPISADSKSKKDWRTDDGDDSEGGLWSGGVDNPLTGEGCNVLIMDDLLKGRASAESATVRDRTHSSVLAEALTRVEPQGSAFAIGTRWHPDDPQGRLIAAGWEHVNLPAIDAQGNALWPERWPLSELKRRRED
jgi:hypothetical protein